MRMRQAGVLAVTECFAEATFVGAVGEGPSCWRFWSGTSKLLSDQIPGGCSCEEVFLEMWGWVWQGFIFSSGGLSRLGGYPRVPFTQPWRFCLRTNSSLPFIPASFITLKIQQPFGKRFPSPTKASLYQLHPLKGKERAMLPTLGKTSSGAERPGKSFWVWSLGSDHFFSPRWAVLGKGYEHGWTWLVCLRWSFVYLLCEW